MTAARLDGNLLDASLVTAAFEIGGEELFDEFHCLVVGDETGGQHDHVRVVVLADQVGDLPSPEPQSPMPRSSSPLSMALASGCAKSG